MLTRQRPTLLTFEDRDEFNQAQRYLSRTDVDIRKAGINQFRFVLKKHCT